jgi:DNA mismatch endonuclease (patch repair protein)
MTDKLSPERRSANMARIRSRHTSPEMIVRQVVYEMGFRYRLHVPYLPGKPDLVFSRLRKIIDVRGCFWHQHRGCVDSHIPKSRLEYWQPKLERNKKRDKLNQRKLRAEGWTTLTLWECELNDLDRTKRRISAFLR